MASASREETIMLARNFRAKFPMSTVTRDNFDLHIIDEGLAEDPGTDDSTTAAYKGFVQQRGTARKRLNNAASKLSESEAFSVDVDKGKPDVYQINPWVDSAMEATRDVGNRVEKFSRNRIKDVSKLRDNAKLMAIESAEADDLFQMLSLVEGYSIVMQRCIVAEVEKFNTAVLAIENKAEALLAIETD